jgi:hypothetical protein
MGFGKVLFEIMHKDIRAAETGRNEDIVLFHGLQNHPVAKSRAAAYLAAQKKAQAPTAPPKVEPKQEPKKAEPAPQMEGRVATVNRKTPRRGKTILDPLAARDEGSTYRKKLLGD